MYSNLERSFSSLEDPRVERNKLHQLFDIIVLTICAVVSGAEGWEAIEEFGQAKQEWLQQFIPLKNGVPSHDCISRVIARLPSEKLTECFVHWVQSVSEITEGEIISIDGKTARHSYDKQGGIGAIHMVSAWANQAGLSLGQIKTEEKSNEITAIPQLLELLEIKGCIVTIDAMGCQKTIAKKIQEKGADYVLAVKGNQGLLEESIRDFFETFLGEAVEPSTFPEYMHYFEETDAGHGRVEVRKHFLSDCLVTLPKTEEWAGLKSIGMVESERHINGKMSKEQRFYIVSFSEDVKKFAHATRGHWGVENSLHWILDVIFREDDSRIRKGYGPENFNVVRQIALNLLKQEKSKISIKKKRFKAALNDKFRESIIFA